MDKISTIKNNSKSRRSFLQDLTKWVGGTAFLAAAANIFTSGKIKADTASVNGIDVFMGEIISFGCNFAPRGYAFCEGQLLPIAQNTALFSLLGTTFGGDGRTTLGLPDLRGRVAIGAGRGPGLPDFRLGERAGVPEVSLTNAQLPSHSHALNVNSQPGNTDNPSGKFIATNAEGIGHYSDAGPTTANIASIGLSGGSDAHTNMMPYLAIYNCIALVGTYPARS